MTNRQMEAKYERAVREKIAAGFMEGSKAGYRTARPFTKDVIVVSREPIERKPLETSTVGMVRRLARRAAQHANTKPRQPAMHKGRRILEG
jgi:hypothetical protein